MSNNKQTAVEWLIEQLGGNGHISTYESIKRDELQSIIEKAKVMHQQEVVDAFGVGCQVEASRLIGYHKMAEQYYKERFGGNK